MHYHYGHAQIEGGHHMLFSHHDRAETSQVELGVYHVPSDRSQSMWWARSKVHHNQSWWVPTKVSMSFHKRHTSVSWFGCEIFSPVWDVTSTLHGSHDNVVRWPLSNLYTDKLCNLGLQEMRTRHNIFTMDIQVEWNARHGTFMPNSSTKTLQYTFWLFLDWPFGWPWEYINPRTGLDQLLLSSVKRWPMWPVGLVSGYSRRVSRVYVWRVSRVVSRLILMWNCVVCEGMDVLDRVLASAKRLFDGVAKGRAPAEETESVVPPTGLSSWWSDSMS